MLCSAVALCVRPPTIRFRASHAFLSCAPETTAGSSHAGTHTSRHPTTHGISPAAAKGGPTAVLSIVRLPSYHPSLTSHPTLDRHRYPSAYHHHRLTAPSLRHPPSEQSSRRHEADYADLSRLKISHGCRCRSMPCLCRSLHPHRGWGGVALPLLSCVSPVLAEKHRSTAPLPAPADRHDPVAAILLSLCA